MSEEIIPVPKEKRTEPHWKALNEIIDPEVNLGIVDLGLIYDVKIDEEGKADVFMTLTSPMCPVGPAIIHQVEDKMRLMGGITSVEVHVVWDPPWTQDRIDPDIREMMFGM